MCVKLGCESFYYALVAGLYDVPKRGKLNRLLHNFCFCFYFLQPLERVGRSIMKENQVPDDLLVISCEEDYQTCAPLLEKGKNYLHLLRILFPSENLGSQLTYTSIK
jgi:hypothetical protein